MNAKRMLAAGILALEMSVPLAGYAASPRPAPDSETTASDASALVAQPPDARPEHMVAYEEARRVKDRGGSGLEVALAYERALRPPPIPHPDDPFPRDPDICLRMAAEDATLLAIHGGSGDQVLSMIDSAARRRCR
ncbi:hypothetical protein [Polyangium aurulentum]|uniref:hypothetical protein n=1 Tax=Polyangium aurulentum TaxID=2567896 RepID=UPI0010AEE1E7|nr:hypothetical protein [Polyangium aurulentum]UQA54809.1 hypothetical protein E8A73_025925 [Polyangium aurulentum]